MLIDNYIEKSEADCTGKDQKEGSLPVQSEEIVRDQQSPPNGLMYMHNRYYSPLLGHFLTPDFRAPDIYDPTTFTEPYAYAAGNPFAYWDPDGLNPEGSGKNTINLSTSLELRTEIHIRQIWNRIDATLQFLDGSIAGRKQDVITSVDQAYDLATLFRHHSLYLKDPELFHFHRQDSEMFMHLWNNFDLVETLQAVISGVEDDWNKTIYLWDRGKYRQSGFQSGGIQNMIGEFVAPAGMINKLPEPPIIDLGLPNTSGSPLLAGAGGTGTFPSSTPSINDFSNFSVGNSLGGNRGLFNNDLDELLDIELEIANSLGVKPVLLGSDDFAKIANHDVLKFVVTKDGQLFLAPHTVGGHEISHAVIARGNAVLTAGQVNISTFGDIRFGIGISNHSGHYLPSGDSLDIAIEIFKKHGIEFSDVTRIR
jgi:RHS repeat-associated protein